MWLKRCGFCLLAVLVVPLAALLAADGVGLSPHAAYARVNFALMRFFRDLSRAKARRRRFDQKGALMSVLLEREEPLPLGDASAGLSLMAEELAEFDGRLLPDSSDRAPLLLAVRGRIYDVTAGAAFYGPGRSYHKLVGKDATRAFCTGCLEPDCLIASTTGLSESQLKEAARWIELYEHHDKYKLVGQVREPPPPENADDAAAEAEAAAAWDLELVARAQAAEGSRKFRPFRLR